LFGKPHVGNAEKDRAKNGSVEKDDSRGCIKVERNPTTHIVKKDPDEN